MSLTDPIANFLTTLRNAMRTHKETVEVPASKLIGKILDLFKNDGYIEDYRLLKNTAQGTLKVYLKYGQDKRSAIIGLKRISTPGRRIYARRGQVPRVLNGLGTAVVSSSKGLLTDRDARKLKVGGEVICYVW